MVVAMSSAACALYVGLAGDTPRSPAARIALAEVDRVDIGRGDVRTIRRTLPVLELVLPDARMSTHHARLSRTAEGWTIEDLGSTNGTIVGADRIKRITRLSDGDVVIVGHTALVFRTSGGEAGDLDPATPIATGLTTVSPALEASYRELVSVATTATPVELVGEAGTNKQAIAEAIHELSGRTGGFVVFACEEVPADEVDAALFGSDDDPGGAVGRAQHGTLLLSQLPALPRGTFASLIGRIESGSELDVRLVTAARSRSDVEVESPNGVRRLTIEVPPLRRRREDLAPTIAALLERLAPDRPITLSGEVVAALYLHDWPLDAREVARSLEAALDNAGAHPGKSPHHVELSHLPPSIGATEPLEQPQYRTVTPAEKTLRDKVADALVRNEGNIAAVGREMGKDPTQIRRWMKRFGLKRA